MTYILTDEADIRLLKAVKEYMLRTGYEVLTPETISKLIADYQEKYKNKNIH